MSHNHPLPVDPRKRALQMNAGAQIQNILNPNKPQPAKGGKPVNHALINRQNLKAAQVKNQIKREEDTARANEEPFKMQRFKNAESLIKQKVAETINTENPHAYTKKGEGKGVIAKLGTLNINRTGLPRRTSGGYSSRGGVNAGAAAGGNDHEDENIYGLSNQQQSTNRGGFDSARSGGDDYDDLSARGGQQYEDGGRFDDEAEEEFTRQQPPQQQHQQRRSGGKQQSQQRSQSYDDDDESITGLISKGPTQQSSTSSYSQSTRPPLSLQGGGGPSEGRSFIQENAKKVIHQSRALASARDESKEAPPTATISKHENFGKVPAYLTEAKNNLAAKKAAMESAQKEKELGIPPGMVLMPEDQRLKTLEVLNENHKKILLEITSFPLRVETISRKKAKAELEEKLVEIEKAITLFSRKRVLIQP